MLYCILKICWGNWVLPHIKNINNRNFVRFWICLWPWLYWRVAEYAVPKFDYRYLEHAKPKYAALVYWLFWSICIWKTPNSGRSFLWTLCICLKTDPLKELSCHKSPFWEFHQPGKIDSSQERRLNVGTTARQTLSQTIILPIYYSEYPFIFPKKNLLLSSKMPHLLFPFPMKIVYNPEF